MDVIRLVLGLFIVIIYMWIFTRIMAFIGKKLHISDLVIYISNILKNVIIKIIVCLTSIVVGALILSGSIDKIFGVLCFIILLLTFIDFSRFRENGDNNV